MDNLRECPFCGRTEFTRCYNEKYGQIIRCPFCGAMISSHISGEDAIQRWNTRHHPKPKALTPKQLREMAKEPLKHWIWIEVVASPPHCKLESAYYQPHSDYTRGEAFCCGYPGMGYCFEYAEYGKTWIAFAAKPEPEGD